MMPYRAKTSYHNIQFKVLKLCLSRLPIKLYWSDNELVLRVLIMFLLSYVTAVEQHYEEPNNIHAHLKYMAKNNNIFSPIYYYCGPDSLTVGLYKYSC